MPSDCTGCDCHGLCSGCGRPSLATLPATRAPNAMRAAVNQNGRRDGRVTWSAGLPRAYFGSTHWPRRWEMTAERATLAASTAMSIAELPAPTTTTSRSTSCAAEL